VYLELWVKVKKDWRNQERYLSEFGFDPENYR
jgi:GTP-binding protein Era